MDPKGVLHLDGASQMEMTQGLTGHLTDLCPWAQKVAETVAP